MSAHPLKFHSTGLTKNPVLIFFHAFPFSGEMWKEQMAHFSKDFYCLAPDLPGFGGSASRDHAVTFESYADAALDFLAESQIKNAVWCGLSMGGYLALRMYERSPELCRALILCDTKSGADGNEAKLKRWSAIQQVVESREEFTAAQWKVLTGEAAKTDGAVKTKFESLMSRVTAEGAACGLAALATRTDTTESLSKIAVPALIVVGKEDKVTPLAEAEALAKAISGSKLVVIPGAGHLSNLENPGAFNAALAGFLGGLV